MVKYNIGLVERLRACEERITALEQMISGNVNDESPSDKWASTWEDDESDEEKEPDTGYHVLRTKSLFGEPLYYRNPSIKKKGGAKKQQFWTENIGEALAFDDWYEADAKVEEITTRVPKGYDVPFPFQVEDDSDDSDDFSDKPDFWVVQRWIPGKGKHEYYEKTTKSNVMSWTKSIKKAKKYYDFDEADGFCIQESECCNGYFHISPIAQYED